MPAIINTKMITSMAMVRYTTHLTALMAAMKKLKSPILLAFIGYEILQSIPLWKLPPLVTVLSVSAMYLGLLELILFTVQIFKPTILLDGYLLLFPLCCVLLVVRLLLKKIREWNALVQNAEAEGQCQIQHGHYHHTIAEQREAFPVNVDQYSDKHDE
jgi:hypothetical protein